MTNKTLDLGYLLKKFIKELERDLISIEEMSIDTNIRSISMNSNNSMKVYTENYYTNEKMYNDNFFAGMSQATKVYLLLLKQANESALLEIKEDYNSLNDETYEQLKLKYRFNDN